jgi:hypothetical protein
MSATTKYTNGVLTIAGLLPNASNFSNKNADKDLSSTNFISARLLLLMMLEHLVVLLQLNLQNILHK